MGTTAGKLGRYTLDHTIGKGPTATVYLAHAAGLAGFERKYAIKVFNETLVGTKGAVDLIAQATAAAKALDHPRLAKLHEYGVSEGKPFVATEVCEGVTLEVLCKKIAEKNDILPLGAILSLLTAIARAVGFANGRRIAHLGLCPSNISCNPGGEPQVMDFGHLEALLSHHAAPLKVLGDRGRYLSPEHIRGEARNASCDTFQIGLIAYELLTGKPAFQGPSDALAQQISNASVVLDDVPSSIRPILAKALHRDPNQRYRNARELAEALDVKQRSSGANGSRLDVGRLVSQLKDSPRAKPSNSDEFNEEPTKVSSGTDLRSLMAATPKPAPPVTPPTVPTKVPSVIGPPATAVPERNSTVVDTGSEKISTARGGFGKHKKSARNQPTLLEDSHVGPQPSPFEQTMRGGHSPLSDKDFSGPTDVRPPDFATLAAAAAAEPIRRQKSAPHSPTLRESQTNVPTLQTDLTELQAMDAMASTRNQVPSAQDSVPEMVPHVNSVTQPPQPKPPSLPRAISAAHSAPTMVPQKAPAALANLPSQSSATAKQAYVPTPLPTSQTPHNNTFEDIELAISKSNTSKKWLKLLLVAFVLAWVVVLGMFLKNNVDQKDKFALAKKDLPKVSASQSSKSVSKSSKAVVNSASSTEISSSSISSVVASESSSSSSVSSSSSSEKSESSSSSTSSEKSEPEDGKFKIELSTKADIYIGHKKIGRHKSVTIDRPAEGTSIAVFAKGHKLATSSFDGSDSMKLELEKVGPFKGRGGIKVRCSRKNRYYVFIDDKPSGQLCPTDRIHVSKGSHTVKVYDLKSGKESKKSGKVTKTNRSKRIRLDVSL